MMKSLQIGKAFTLLEPGPVVLVTTHDGGKDNVMTISWTMVVDFTPRFAITTGPWNHSYAALRRTKECVIAIPTVEIAKSVVGCGNASGRDVDKFAAFDLTPLPASRVGAPLVGECYANLECRIADARMVVKYNFFVLEVLAAWTAASRKVPRTIHHRGYGSFMVAGRTIRLPSGMA